MSDSSKAPLWLLVLITISGTLAMHMFVPALPEAGHALGAGTAAMQATISIYIVGLGCGQLIYGPLSDAIGRRPILLAGLILYAVAGFAASMATSVQMLVAVRLFQALGGCAGLALGRAIVRDTAQPDRAVADLALLNLMMMIGPGLAPLAGSGLLAVGGWRSVLVALAVLGGITAIFAWRLLPETGHPSGRFTMGTMGRDYAALLRSPAFVGFAVGGGCATTSVYAYVAAAPFIVTTQLHRPAHEVGIYLALLLAGMSVGNALTRRFAGKVPLDRLLIGGNLLSVLGAAALLAIVAFDALSVPTMVGCMSLFAMGCGIASPAALTKALGVDTHLVGSAAGLYGFTQMAVGALCTFLVGFGSNPGLAAAAVLTGATVVAQLAFRKASRYRYPNAAPAGGLAKSASGRQ